MNVVLKPEPKTLLESALRAIEVEDEILAKDPDAKDRRALWRAYEWMDMGANPNDPKTYVRFPAAGWVEELRDDHRRLLNALESGVGTFDPGIDGAADYIGLLLRLAKPSRPSLLEERRRFG